MCAPPMETDLVRYFGDRCIAVAEKLYGPIHPTPHDTLMRRKAHQTLELASKMIGANPCRACEFDESKRLRQLVFDLLENTLQASERKLSLAFNLGRGK